MSGLLVCVQKYSLLCFSLPLCFYFFTLPHQRWNWSCGFPFCCYMVSLILRCCWIKDLIFILHLKINECSFLFLVIHDVQSSRGQWTASVPMKIPALQGSCVVIPCTYTYPKPTSNKILNRWRGFWRKGNKIVTTNLRKWKLPEEYKKRTQFLGSLESRNCTMLLDGIRKTDVGPFYFRIEMPQYKSFSYTKNAVSIDVIREYYMEYFNIF